MGFGAGFPVADAAPIGQFPGQTVAMVGVANVNRAVAQEYARVGRRVFLRAAQYAVKQTDL